MLLGNPVEGTIRVDARYYPSHPRAVLRTAGNHDPLITLDFGPSTVDEEPTVNWPGGESDIFGEPIPAKKYTNFHAAIDISSGDCVADVLAAADGKVSVSHRDASGAKVIVIDHKSIGGHTYRTGYVHLSERFVEVGAGVVAGKVIGKIGKTGISLGGCHLHFFVEKSGRRVDPWRRLAQNATIDPDAPIVIAPVEVPDVPIPASNDEYLAGRVAVIGNPTVGAKVRAAPKVDATLIRTVPGGATETWLPTCFVKGDAAFDSDRWLTRWHQGQWEFTHAVNVESVTPL